LAAITRSASAGDTSNVSTPEFVGGGAPAWSLAGAAAAWLVAVDVPTASTLTFVMRYDVCGLPSASVTVVAMLTRSPGVIALATPWSASTVTVTATRSCFAIAVASGPAAPWSADTNVSAVMNCFVSIRPAATLPARSFTFVTTDGGIEPLATFSVWIRPAATASSAVVPFAMSLVAT
jgi:hypothetical protein